MHFNMNDNGDNAFRYVPANGTFGIAVANVVPKPSSAIMLAIGCLLCSGQTLGGILTRALTKHYRAPKKRRLL